MANVKVSAIAARNAYLKGFEVFRCKNGYEKVLRYKEITEDGIFEIIPGEGHQQIPCK